MEQNEALTEKKKYKYVWELQSYRESSPGLHALKMMSSLGFDFFDEISRQKAKTFIDIGCGSGKASDFLMRNHQENLDVYGFDLADNCLDEDSLPFQKENYLTIGDLTKNDAFNGKKWDISFCSDVMEHIATKDVPCVLRNIRGATTKCGFLGIALFPDDSELHTGPLHLTVKDPSWWDTKIKEAGFKIKWSKEIPYRLHQHAVDKEKGKTFSSILINAIAEKRVIRGLKRRLKLWRRRGWYFVIVE
jgi:SAM-dependent methyltransferase